MEIMKLWPAGKDYLWGGTRLRDEFGKQINLTPLAETWECSVHPDGPSTVVNGEYEGRTLPEVLQIHPEYLGTKVGDRKELPILVKLIDAKEQLSIQVHPDDAYANVHEGQNGKSEMWYILDADDGASIIYGFMHPVSRELIRKDVLTGKLEKHLQRVYVHKGEVFYVPAGTVHSIGAGILIAEVQESSNITYRVYDYNRTGPDGKLRQLHLDQALDIMNMHVAPDAGQKHRFVRYYPGCSREIICRCKYFETEKDVITRDFSFSVQEESFQILLCLNGKGQLKVLDQSTDPVRFQKGDCLFLPANLGRCCLTGAAEMLKIRC